MVTRLRLAQILDERGLTRAWLARETGLSYQAIHHLYAGEVAGITLDTVDRLAAALKCEPGDLFERSAKRGKA